MTNTEMIKHLESEGYIVKKKFVGCTAGNLMNIIKVKRNKDGVYEDEEGNTYS